jgi:hypothetical protein
MTTRRASLFSLALPTALLDLGFVTDGRALYSELVTETSSLSLSSLTTSKVSGAVVAESMPAKGFFAASESAPAPDANTQTRHPITRQSDTTATGQPGTSTRHTIARQPDTQQLVNQTPKPDSQQLDDQAHSNWSTRHIKQTHTIRRTGFAVRVDVAHPCGHAGVNLGEHVAVSGL